MRQRFTRPLVLVVMLASAMSVTADTAVTFDFQSGRGSVDRSTIQTAFALNNGQMQKRAEQVVFTAVETHTIAVNCASGAVEEARMEVISTVDFTTVPARGPFDAFEFAGFGDILIADPPPAEEICGGPGTLGRDIRVVRSLSASLGGQSVLLLEEH